MFTCLPHLQHLLGRDAIGCEVLDMLEGGLNAGRKCDLPLQRQAPDIVPRAGAKRIQPEGIRGRGDSVATWAWKGHKWLGVRSTDLVYMVWRKIPPHTATPLGSSRTSPLAWGRSRAGHRTTALSSPRQSLASAPRRYRGRGGRLGTPRASGSSQLLSTVTVSSQCCHRLRLSRRNVCRGPPHHGSAAGRWNPHCLLNESNPLLLLLLMMMLTAGEHVP